MLVGPFNLLIPEGVKQNSSDVFNILDRDTGGAATFSVRLSADGQMPITHWAARTYLEEPTANALFTMTVQDFKTYVDQMAVVKGRTPVGSITAFKGALIHGQGDFWAFVASQGLQLVSIPE